MKSLQAHMDKLRARITQALAHHPKEVRGLEKKLTKLQVKMNQLAMRIQHTQQLCAGSDASATAP